MKLQTPYLVFVLVLLSSFLATAAQGNFSAYETIFKQVSAIDSEHPPTFTDYKTCHVIVTEATIGLSMPAMLLGAAAIMFVLHVFLAFDGL
ncbi:hypothetical protein IFR05_003039 [Cadophora sp. M221]|nr:hypothetical protein IFR05_003039 [Cadophora sp. M221]